MFRFIVSAATFAAFASAYTTPTSQCTDSCNPITKPGLNEVVPAGTAYTISWNPTTTGTVTILLEKGPSTNIIPLYPVAEKIANTGTFTWTPAADLQPTGNSGYGFQLINDADGTYQWSTQFGISNAGYVAGGSSSAAAGTASSSAAAGYVSSSAASSSSIVAAAGNGTFSSAAASASSVPTGYSNSTAAITSAGLTAASSTLSTASATKASTSSSSSTPSSGAVVLGASVGSSFFALVAAAAAFAL